MPPPPALLAQSTTERFVVSPIQLHDVWKMYKTMLASFWTVEEVDLSQDRKDFLTLEPKAQECIRNVLAFFAIADGIVVENLIDNFCREMTMQEIKFAYATQAFMETIHSEMYSALLETVIPDRKQREQTIQLTVTGTHIANKTAYCQQYMNAEVPFAERLIAFAAVEGVLFSASFAFVYWLKTKGKMPGFTFSNELIARDEGMHRDLGVLLYTNYMQSERLTDAKVHQIIHDAVILEQEFVKSSMKDGLLGLQLDDMCTYIEFIADHLITSLGHVAKYNRTNPLHFMELISLQGKTNFFEKRVGEYKKTNVGDDNPDRFRLTDFGEQMEF